MKRYLMKCGHIINKPPYYCKRCNCEELICELPKSKYGGLENRKAFNVLTGKMVKSNWDLPGFKYTPQEAHDYYMTNSARRRYTPYK